MANNPASEGGDDNFFSELLSQFGGAEASEGDDQELADFISGLESDSKASEEKAMQDMLQNLPNNDADGPLSNESGVKRLLGDLHGVDSADEADEILAAFSAGGANDASPAEESPDSDAKTSLLGILTALPDDDSAKAPSNDVVDTSSAEAEHEQAADGPVSEQAKALDAQDRAQEETAAEGVSLEDGESRSEAVVSAESDGDEVAQAAPVSEPVSEPASEPLSEPTSAAPSQARGDGVLAPESAPEAPSPGEDGVLAAKASAMRARPAPPKALPPRLPPQRAPEPEPFDDAPAGLTLKDLFGIDSPTGDGELADGQAEHESPADIARVEDPLAPRRMFAERRLHKFFVEKIANREKLAVVRFLMMSGLESVSIPEFEEALILEPSVLEPSLDALVKDGILLRDKRGYSLNPRSRSLVLLGTLVTHWQDRAHRQKIWQWLNDG